MITRSHSCLSQITDSLGRQINPIYRGDWQLADAPWRAGFWAPGMRFGSVSGHKAIPHSGKRIFEYLSASMALLGLRGPNVVDAAAGCCHHSKRICTGLPRSSAPPLRAYQLSHHSSNVSFGCQHRRARSPFLVSAAAHSVQAG